MVRQCSDLFRLDLGDFTVETDIPPVTWFIDDTKGYSGGASAHFANPSTGTYHLTGDTASGRLVSPVVTVPEFAEGTTFLQFMFYMDTEWTQKANWQKLFSYLDELSVKVRKDGVTEEDPIWVSHFVQNSTFGSWLMTCRGCLSRRRFNSSSNSTPVTPKTICSLGPTSMTYVLVQPA